MANPYFGDVGDVWKHLPLLELLRVDAPRFYWESHAGSARYPLTRSWERDYGVFRFLEGAARLPALGGSRYYAALRGLPAAAGLPREYPGSALQAMLTLGRGAEGYLFCDLDPASVADLAAAAADLGLADRVRCRCADGLTTLWDEGRAWPTADGARTVVHIDPFDPFAPGSDGGLSAVDLAVELAARGFKVAFWYRLETPEQRGWAWEHLRQRLPSGTPLWCGEVSLAALDDPRLPPNPGVRGCGLVCAHFTAAAVAAAARLGEELAVLYREARLPGGASGALHFTQWPG